MKKTLDKGTNAPNCTAVFPAFSSNARDYWRLLEITTDYQPTNAPSCTAVFPELVIMLEITGDY